MSEQQNREAQLLKCRTADSKQKTKLNMQKNTSIGPRQRMYINIRINEVKNARCEILTAKTTTHISSFFFVATNLRFQLSIYKIITNFAYTSK